MKQIQVKPLVSVGDIRFGMERAKVRSILGTAEEFKKTSSSKNTTDDFGFCHVYYDENDKCIAVELFNDVEVFIGSVSLFSSTFNELKTVLPDLQETKSQYKSKEFSCGFYVPNGEVETILFGIKNYYK